MFCRRPLEGKTIIHPTIAIKILFFHLTLDRIKFNCDKAIAITTFNLYSFFMHYESLVGVPEK